MTHLRFLLSLLKARRISVLTFSLIFLKIFLQKKVFPKKTELQLKNLEKVEGDAKNMTDFIWENFHLVSKTPFLLSPFHLSKKPPASRSPKNTEPASASVLSRQTLESPTSVLVSWRCSGKFLSPNWVGRSSQRLLEFSDFSWLRHVVTERWKFPDSQKNKSVGYSWESFFLAFMVFVRYDVV